MTTFRCTTCINYHDDAHVKACAKTTAHKIERFHDEFMFALTPLFDFAEKILGWIAKAVERWGK